MADPLQAFIEQNKGLLSFEPTEDDRKKALTYGLIGAGLGILSANAQNPRGAGFGGAVSGAMPGFLMYQQTLANAPKERMQQFSGLLQFNKLKKDIEAQDVLKRFTAGNQPNYQGAQQALTDGGASGDLGPTVTNAARIPHSTPQIPDFGGLLAAGIPGETVKALMEDWKLRHPEVKVDGGYAYNPREVKPGTFLPRIEFNQQGQGVGITPDPRGGMPSMSPLPGSLDTFTAFQKASKATDADYRLRDVPQSDGTTRLMTEGDFIRSQRSPSPVARAIPGKPAGFPVISPQEQALRDAEAATIRAREGIPGGGGAIPSESVLGVKPKPPSTGQGSVDAAFAKEYVDFKAAGGFADTQKQLRQLEDASNELGRGGLTGPTIGNMPDVLLQFTNPKAIAVRERIEEVVQRNLRSILGPQFTEKEGERLIGRAFNPKLNGRENKRRVDALIGQIRNAALAKQDAADYFEQNGTLAGWQGRLYTIEDFRSLGEDEKASPAPLTPEERKELEELRRRLRK